MVQRQRGLSRASTLALPAAAFLAPSAALACGHHMGPVGFLIALGVPILTFFAFQSFFSRAAQSLWLSRAALGWRVLILVPCLALFGLGLTVGASLSAELPPLGLTLLLAELVLLMPVLRAVFGAPRVANPV